MYNEKFWQSIFMNKGNDDTFEDVKMDLFL